MRRKVITLRFLSTQEAIEFLEYITRIYSKEMIGGEIKGTTVRLFLKASFSSDEAFISRIKEAIGHWKSSRRPNVTGEYRHNIRMILSQASLEVGIPVRAIIDVLKLKGFKARLEGGHIVTNADHNTLVSIISEFSSRYAEALRIIATPMLKRLVAVIATVQALNVEDALNNLYSRGVASLKDNRWTLTVNYDSALKILEMNPSAER